MSLESRANYTEKKELPPKIKVVIIEDQYWPQLALLNGLKINFGDMIDDFSDGKDVLLVRNYEDAEKLLKDENFKADIVFLDNKLVTTPINQSEQKKNTFDDDLKKFDSEKFDLYDDPKNFSDLPWENGYTLIDAFKKRGCIVVGTSSMSNEELRSKGLSGPEYQVDKTKINGESTAELKKKLVGK